MASKKRRNTSTRISGANAREAGMIGKWFPQVIANEPADAESICSMPHQLASGSDALEEHDELQLEKDELVQRKDDHRLRRSPEQTLARTRDQVFAPDADRSDLPEPTLPAIHPRAEQSFVAWFPS
jgi:hypothetical protein